MKFLREKVNLFKLFKTIFAKKLHHWRLLGSYLSYSFIFNVNSFSTCKNMLKICCRSREKRGVISVPSSVNINKLTYSTRFFNFRVKFQRMNFRGCKLDQNILCKLNITLNTVLDLDRGCKLNVHKTFGRRPGYLWNILPNLNSLEERPWTFISYLYCGL